MENKVVQASNDQLFPLEPDTCYYARACKKAQYNVEFIGFYALYHIDVRKPDDDAESDGGEQKGMKSTWGKRGIIIEKFGWTWEYLNWGIPFVVIQRIMADMPWYDYKASKKKSSSSDRNTNQTKLTSDNVGDVLALFNSIPR